MILNSITFWQGVIIAAILGLAGSSVGSSSISGLLPISVFLGLSLSALLGGRATTTAGMECLNNWEEGLLQLSNNTALRNVSIFFALFFGLLVSNWAGLFVFIHQSFMGNLSLSLILITLGFWGLSYVPFTLSNKEKFTLFLVGDMNFPILSFLLSNIEILTQFFRPITLLARLWVNIWVGHLLISTISFALVASVAGNTWSTFNFSQLMGIFSSITIQGGFFVFEVGIMSLQAFVFTYLVGVYLSENTHFAESHFPAN